jgi:hypothetical protein
VPLLYKEKVIKLSKKNVVATKGVVLVQTEADQLAALMNSNKTVEAVVPGNVEPSVQPITVETLRELLKGNPELAKEAFAGLFPEFKASTTKRVYVPNAGSDKAKATFTKHATRSAFVKVVFDQKPDESIRTELKEAGYRWSKVSGAWEGPKGSLINSERFGTDIAKVR